MSAPAQQYQSSLRDYPNVDIDAWYRRYGEAIHRRCLRLTRDDSAAWDLTQETFLRAHKYKESYNGKSAPLAWLCAISDRCFFDSLRKKKPLCAQEIADFVRQEEEQDPVAVFSCQDTVTKLLARVPHDVRQIVIHRYFDELEHGQIAARLGINERTVRRKLERFLTSARTLLRRA